MKTIGNEPAIPVIEHGSNGETSISLGLTKREHFAAMAMQGLWQSTTDRGYDECERIAEMAVKQADALIKALNE